jgi:uncharacterized protein YbjT (DUF2867 family)
MDLREAIRAEHWRAALQGIDAVVNAAGVLQDGGRDSTASVHRDAPAALYEACARAGVRRVVHISAMGAGEPGLSDFSATKHDAEHALSRSGLDWVILRPSVVGGRAAYGGSALFRGLAALPVQPALAGAGRIQVVQLDEVAETVARLVCPDAPHGIALDIAGPQAMTVEEVVAHYRRWLGWRPARLVRLPGFLMRLAYWSGDLAGILGWRPPIRSTARREMARGAVGDPSRWSEVTGIEPRSLSDALAAEPASVQERWFARLFLLKPLVFLVFGLFWILTGIVSLTSGRAIGEALMREGGAGALSGPSVVAGALADLAIGIGILFRPTTKPALLAALAISIFYVIAGTALLPRLWDDPLGPMMKIWPILLLNLVALAILDDR